MKFADKHTKPLYFQIKEKIISDINSGHLKHGQKLPSERELCEIFDVSRITIRRAIDEAIKDGYLYNDYGRGTFVGVNNSTKFGQSMEEILRLEDLLKTQNGDGKTDIISIEKIPADMQIASLLSIEIGKLLYYMKLISYSNNEPVVFYKSYFPEAIGQHMVKIAKELEAESSPFSSLDLYQAYHGERPTKIKYSMESIIAEGENEEIFSNNGHEALTKVSSIFLLPNLQPTEYRQAYYVGDKHIFYMTGHLEWD